MKNTKVLMLSTALMNAFCFGKVFSFYWKLQYFSNFSLMLESFQPTSSSFSSMERNPMSMLSTLKIIKKTMKYLTMSSQVSVFSQSTVKKNAVITTIPVIMMQCLTKFLRQAKRYFMSIVLLYIPHLDVALILWMLQYSFRRHLFRQAARTILTNQLIQWVRSIFLANNDRPIMATKEA